MTPDEQSLFRKAGQEWATVNIRDDASYSVLARNNMEKAGVKFYDMDDAGEPAPIFLDTNLGLNRV